MTGSHRRASGSARCRILFLLPFPPRLDGMHGGSRTTAWLLSEIAGRHSAAAVYLRAPEEPPIDPALQARLARCIEVIRPRSGHGLFSRSLERLELLRGLMLGRPMWVTRWQVREFGSAVERLVREWPPDIVQLEFHLMGQYLPALHGSGARTVLVQHDPGFRTAAEVASTHRGLERILGLWDARAWRRYERRVMSDVDAVVAFTRHDADDFGNHTPAPVVEIPLGTELPAEPLDSTGSKPPRLVFIGNFIHPPNVDGALRLGRDIFPAVRRARPGVQLDLVGDQPPPDVRALATADIRVTGRVPEVTEYLDRAAMVVAPLRLGGGMRVKVLEALAGGKAVVATRLAAEGLTLHDGKQIVFAESDAEFRDRIVELLDDEPRRRAIARGARVWALDNLGWGRTAAAYERLYDRLLEGSRPMGPAHMPSAG